MNFKQAPKLYHSGKKKQGIFYQLPQDLIDIVFNTLDGKNGNQIKLMCVLLGTQGNGSFGVSEKWICERTGMVQQTYNKARKALIDRGWLKLEEGKLFVLVSAIYAEGTTSNCANIILESQDTTSNCVVKAQSEIVSRHNMKLCQGTTSNCVDTISKSQGTTSELKAQSEIVSPAQSENVYNIKGINNNNKKEIDNEKDFSYLYDEVGCDGYVRKEKKWLDRMCWNLRTMSAQERIEYLETLDFSHEEAEYIVNNILEI